MRQRYLIALGSNKRHHRHGRPEQVLAAAVEALEQAGLNILAQSPNMRSTAIGPSLRRYANGALVAECDLDPEELLVRLKAIERQFGRRSLGQRWTARVLDLDIILWSGRAWASPGLVVPHRLFRVRPFVLGPSALIAPTWRDPVTGLTLRQLSCRLARPVKR